MTTTDFYLNYPKGPVQVLQLQLSRVYFKDTIQKIIDFTSPIFIKNFLEISIQKEDTYMYSRFGFQIFCKTMSLCDSL